MSMNIFQINYLTQPNENTPCPICCSNIELFPVK